MENVVCISNEFLSDFISVRNKYLFSLISSSTSVINEFTKVYNRAKEENKKYSIFFNPLKYFKINETLHSQMLADLLNPNSTHGQGRLFLNLFLKKLEIINPESGNWKITAEIGRIDVLLVRERDPHSVIVIENKSNNAVDQNNQLYRYWYQEIYVPNKNIAFAKKETYEDAIIKSRYKIIYLPPDDSKMPQEFSLKKPDYLTDSILPDEIPIKYEHRTFKKFICEWLGESIEKIEPENYRLKIYLNQYIELWN